MEVDKLFSQSPEFITKRIYLRRLSLKDSEEYFQFASDPEVTTFTMWEAHRNIDDSRNYINYVIDKYLKKEAYHWEIVYKKTSQLIGRTGLVSWDTIHQKTEIGFVLSRMYWNQAIATEATKEIINYCFQELNMNRIEGRCNYNNTGSARVMEKLGMKFEGVLREQLKINGIFEDQKIYSILKSDRKTL